MGTIRGTRDHVTRRLWAAQQAGQDVMLSNPRVLPDGRWEVDVAPRRPVAPTQSAAVLQVAAATPTRVAPVRESRRRAYAIGAGIGAAAALLGLAVWGLLALVAWVASHVAELIGIAVTLALIGALLARIGLGGGSGHCSGPNSGH